MKQIFLLLYSSVCLADFFHVNEVTEHRKFSYGITIKESIYFISSQHRFKRPNWLGRLPDGGQPKTVSYQLMLFKFDLNSREISKVDLLSSNEAYGINIKGAQFLYDNNKLLLAYRCNNTIGDEFNNKCFFSCQLDKRKCTLLDSSADKKSILGKFVGYWNQYRDRLVTISKVKRLFYE